MGLRLQSVRVTGRAMSYRSAASGQLQRVVDLGPDGLVARITSQLRARRGGRAMRHDDGTGIVPEGWFADLYEANTDPWDYTTSAYERRKYALMLAALPTTGTAPPTSPAARSGC